MFEGDDPEDLLGIRVSDAGDVNADGFPDIMATASDDAADFNAGVVRVFSGADGSVLYSWRDLVRAPSYFFGNSIAAAGDVNADGHADVVVSATHTASGGTNGSARVYSGIDGTLLYAFDGPMPGDGFTQVGGAGDVNSNAYADLIVGGTGNDAGGTSAGVARVFSGANGSILHEVFGSTVQERVGSSVDGAGDLNGDGRSDLIVGAPGANAATGRVTVHSGLDSTVLYTFAGNTPNAHFGISVAGAGDVDADGVPDVVVGAPSDETFHPFGGSVRVLSGADGSMLYEWFGTETNGYYGRWVSSAGDVDGDGHADLAMTWSGNYPEALRILHVRSGFDGSILYELGPDTTGVPFDAIHGAGDVNGDGYSDLVAASTTAGTDRVFVLSGHEHLVSYCFGDAGALCPCLNTGGPAEGCANSSGAGGALDATGSASIADDELTFSATQLLPSQPALLFAGANAVNGGDGLPFGDGLRCAGGDVQRLGIETPDGAGNATFGPGLSSRGGWSPGEVRRFQVWYRDPSGPCGFTFNLTNGLEVVLSL